MVVFRGVDDSADGRIPALRLCNIGPSAPASLAGGSAFLPSFGL
jgi:hypothetical protein